MLLSRLWNIQILWRSKVWSRIQRSVLWWSLCNTALSRATLRSTKIHFRRRTCWNLDLMLPRYAIYCSFTKFQDKKPYLESGWTEHLLVTVAFKILQFSGHILLPVFIMFQTFLEAVYSKNYWYILCINIDQKPQRFNYMLGSASAPKGNWYFTAAKVHQHDTSIGEVCYWCILTYS